MGTARAEISKLNKVIAKVKKTKIINYFKNLFKKIISMVKLLNSKKKIKTTHHTLIYF